MRVARWLTVRVCVRVCRALTLGTNGLLGTLPLTIRALSALEYVWWVRAPCEGCCVRQSALGSNAQGAVVGQQPHQWVHPRRHWTADYPKVSLSTAPVLLSSAVVYPFLTVLCWPFLYFQAPELVFQRPYRRCSRGNGRAKGSRVRRPPCTVLYGSGARAAF